MNHAVAQTNLQLYAQMLEAGYPESALELVNRAYLFVAQQTCGVIRGSGKPFVCHLVGTASLLVCEQQPPSLLAASLLHATYQNRVPFPGGRDLEARREYIRDCFGEEVESIVHDYHDFEVARLDAFSDQQLLERRPAVLMRLADELEDLLDHGLAMHGRPGDTEAVGGSAASRRLQKLALADQYLRAARVADARHLLAELQHWLKQTREAAWPASLRTGQYSSFEVGQPIWSMT